MMNILFYVNKYSVSGFNRITLSIYLNRYTWRPDVYTAAVSSSSETGEHIFEWAGSHAASTFDNMEALHIHIIFTYTHIK